MRYKPIELITPGTNGQRFISKWSHLAILSYRLAIFSPLMIPVMALIFSPMIYTPHERDSSAVFYWAFCSVFPISVILGIIAQFNIHNSDIPMRGSNYATSGIIVGMLGFAASIEIFPQLIHQSPYDNFGRSVSCVSNLKELSLGALMYAEDYDGFAPPLQSWNVAILEYTKNTEIYHCPTEFNQTDPSYALENRLHGIVLKELENPDRTVMLFESRSGKNLFGGHGLLPDPPRHLLGNSIGFVDGHVKSCKKEMINELIWHPVSKLIFGNELKEKY